MVARIRITRSFIDRKKVEKAVRDGSIKSLSRAGAFTRAVAKNSMKRKLKNSKPGPPGTPAMTKGRAKSAILFEVEDNNQLVRIGFESDIVDQVMTAHEFGGRYKRQRYPKRPVMGPALKIVTPRLEGLWANVI